MIHNEAIPVVRAQGLRKCFGRRVAVDGIDFCIPRGLCFGFLGPNGAGKTTTLRMLMGLSPKDGGELTVLGLPVPERARETRARVGLVPQADTLDPDFTVAENLRVYAGYFRIPRAAIDARIDELLAFANLSDRRDARVETLSGGMKRRLTIARALVNDPEIVILDEPTTGLDPQVRHVIWGRLAELRARGVTLILTTHYMEEAERLCDTLVVMDQGRILDQGSPSELVARHVEPEVVELRGAPDEALLARLGGMDARIERHGSSVYVYTQDAAPLLAHLGAVHGRAILHRPSGLEDVFLRLTGRELRE
ncbi:MAG: ATP-binding cassette domain-containing protein [Halothiobacillaceae bacterium]|jgi:lipooligosaccharide transport system ATP-binding protein|nr:ATP-binding cassette domain-containing protein [Halothiobacillaceae bacterium]MDY0050255.1 ATP-binding cassette domain-containing protein [Halothiobacillaceae bacterium]